MLPLLRSLHFDRMRALRALTRGSRSPLAASWRVTQHFYWLVS
jgi:hypothetical protein